MKASSNLINKIQEFEGCKLFAYRDSKGIPTIGIGHTRNVTMGSTCTKEQALAWLAEDLKDAEKGVEGLSIALSQNQFDALVDFVYNVGISNLKASTLFKKIRANAPTKEIQEQFRRWVYAGKVKLPGLVKRRNWEAELWARK